MSVLCHSGGLKRPRTELAEVFRRYLGAFLKTHRLSHLQQKVVQAIQACRTALLGYHLWRCTACVYERLEYNSCRNRHCPKCQMAKKVKWVKARLSELLPIPYYHTVFTMPHSLNTLALYNKKVIYEMFFNAAAHTLNAFAQDPRFLGAKIGFIGILHTWGQTLSHHVPPVRDFIVTGGGISNDGTRWLNLPYRKKFLFPARAVSRRMRKRFAQLLRKAYYTGKLRLTGRLAYLTDAAAFERFVNRVAWENWHTYMKKPFAGPEEVVKYIGRYTHRIAISNHRLLDIEDGKITFRYKKYKDNKVEHRTMTLSADEFIRRFLLHVVPRGFKRIRHFGFLAPGCRTRALKVARNLLKQAAEKLEEAKSTFESWFENIETRRCPACKSGILKLIEVLAPRPWVPG